MKNLVNQPANQPLTMSSRDIAEYTGKQHQHVKRDIESMFYELGLDVSKVGRIYKDSMNRNQTEYHLDRDQTDCLLTGYSAKARMKVIMRWKELESLSAPVATLPDHTAEVMELRSQLSIAERKKELADEYNSLVLGTKLLPVKTREQIESEFLLRHINETGQRDEFLIEQSLMRKKGSPFAGLKRGEGRQRIRRTLNKVQSTLH